MGYYLSSLCAESFLCSTFCSIFITFFSHFFFGSDLFSTSQSFVLVLSFDFFVFYLVFFKLENGFQKMILSNFNLCLGRFGYCETFFLGQDISLWFCGVFKLRWLA